MNFIRKHFIGTITVIVIIAFLIAILIIKHNKEIQKNPLLAKLSKNYDTEPKLSQDQIDKLQSEIQKYRDQIDNFVPGTGEKEIDLGGGMKGIAMLNQKPNLEWFLNMAVAQQNLGKYSDAIDTYNQLGKIYPANEQGLSQLADLCDNLGEDDLLVIIYKKLITIDNEYSKRLINVYMRQNDIKLAYQTYLDYVKRGGKRDIDLMQRMINRLPQK